MHPISRFLANARAGFSHHGADVLSPAERRRLAYSIAQFERGESSEGRDFLAFSAAFAAAAGDPAFHEATVLFIREENFHATLLGRFMEHHGIPRARAAWSDVVFRWLRHRDELAWCCRVLLTAEILAQIYYPALRAASGSAHLQAICDRIIRDERFHIRFQTERIGRMLARHHPLRCAVHAVAGWVLFVGTILVVWVDHRPVLSALYTPLAYARACWLRYRYALRLIARSRRAAAAQPGPSLQPENPLRVP